MAHTANMAQVKSLPSQSQEDFDKSYEVEEVHVLRDSRIVITTCATASKLKMWIGKIGGVGHSILSLPCRIPFL